MEAFGSCQGGDLQAVEGGGGERGCRSRCRVSTFLKRQRRPWEQTGWAAWTRSTDQTGAASPHGLCLPSGRKGGRTLNWGERRGGEGPRDGRS